MRRRRRRARNRPLPHACTEALPDERGIPPQPPRVGGRLLRRRHALRAEQGGRAAGIAVCRRDPERRRSGIMSSERGRLGSFSAEWQQDDRSDHHRANT